MPRSSPPEELQHFKEDSEVHQGILHTKPGLILPVAGREASVVKIYVFPGIAYKPPYFLINKVTRPRMWTPLCGNEAHRCPAPSYTAQTPGKGAKTPKITKILSILKSGKFKKIPRLLIPF